MASYSVTQEELLHFLNTGEKPSPARPIPSKPTLNWFGASAEAVRIIWCLAKAQRIKLSCQFVDGKVALLVLPRQLKDWVKLCCLANTEEQKDSPVLVALPGISGGTSGLNFLLNEVNETPGTLSAWTDVQDTTNIPAGATGAILRLDNQDVSNRNLSVRKNGSTDTLTPIQPAGRHTGAMVGLDASRIFEAYTTHASAKVLLIGYTTDSTDFFIDALNRTPASTGSWVDVDVSADIPSGATGVIVKWTESTNTEYLGGIRNNGSTDTFTYGIVEAAATRQVFQACGVDASRIFEAQINNTNIRLWLVGYFMAPVSFEVNAVSYALGVTSAWTAITVSGGNAPATADGALWLINNTSPEVGGSAYGTGVRKNGSTDNPRNSIRKANTYSYFCGLDGSRIAEGWITNVAVDHYVIGYAKPAGGVTYTEDVLSRAGARAAFTIAVTFGITPIAIARATALPTLAQTFTLTPSATARATALPTTGLLFIIIPGALAGARAHPTLAQAITMSTGARAKGIAIPSLAQALALSPTARVGLQATPSLAQALTVSPLGQAGARALPTLAQALTVNILARSGAQAFPSAGILFIVSASARAGALAIPTLAQVLAISASTRAGSRADPTLQQALTLAVSARAGARADYLAGIFYLILASARSMATANFLLPLIYTILASAATGAHAELDKVDIEGEIYSKAAAEEQAGQVKYRV